MKLIGEYGSIKVETSESEDMALITLTHKEEKDSHGRVKTRTQCSVWLTLKELDDLKRVLCNGLTVDPNSLVGEEVIIKGQCTTIKEYRPLENVYVIEPPIVVPDTRYSTDLLSLKKINEIKFLENG